MFWDFTHVVMWLYKWDALMLRLWVPEVGLHSVCQIPVGCLGWACNLSRSTAGRGRWWSAGIYLDTDLVFYDVIIAWLSFAPSGWRRKYVFSSATFALQSAPSYVARVVLILWEQFFQVIRSFTADHSHWSDHGHWRHNGAWQMTARVYIYRPTRRPLYLWTLFRWPISFVTKASFF